MLHQTNGQDGYVKGRGLNMNASTTGPINVFRPDALLAQRRPSAQPRICLAGAAVPGVVNGNVDDILVVPAELFRLLLSKGISCNDW